MVLGTAKPLANVKSQGEIHFLLSCLCSRVRWLWPSSSTARDSDSVHGLTQMIERYSGGMKMEMFE